MRQVTDADHVVTWPDFSIEETVQPVEMALEAALLLIQNGGSTVAADRSLRNILKGHHTEGVSVVWRLDFIAASSTADRHTSTVVRAVGPIGVNLVRASAVAVLSDRVARGQVDTATVSTELARIRNLPAPYNRWALVAAAAAAGAAFSQIPGGDWGSLAIAFVAAGMGQCLRSILQARRFPVAHVTLACAVLSACMASAGLRLGLSQVVPATLIGSVIYLAPGLPLINGFVDVASHRYLMVGVERIVNATFLFLVMALSIAFAYAVIA